MANRPRSLSMGDAMRLRSFFPHSAQPHRQLVSAGRSREAIDTFISALPTLSEKDLIALNEIDSNCPICLNPFRTIIAEEEMALAMDSPATPAHLLGVTKLPGCSHMYCRKDIVNWFSEQGRNTCPSCRHPLSPNLPTDARAFDMDEEFTDLHALEDGVIQAAGSIPLTPEQASSIRSAIMLLTEGDGVGHFAMPETMSGHHDQAVGGRVHEEDRHAFSGMYS